MNESEQFELHGELVGTGLNMPGEIESGLMATLTEYPDSMNLEDADIERLLKVNGQDRYLLDRKNRQPRMRNQGSLGKCNASSNVAAIETLRDYQGMPDIALSDCYLYSLMNGGRDAGSGLITSLSVAQARGVAPMEIQVGGVTKTLSNSFYNRNQVDDDLLKQADIEAKRFLGFEYFKAPMASFEAYCRAIASALARRQQVIFAWHVGAGSMSLRNGYAVVGRGPGNHSNVLHSAKWVGGKTLVHPDDQNSWGPSVNPLYGRVSGQGWGQGGFGLFTMEDVWACAHNHCTYICTSVRVDSNDPAFN